MTTHMDYSSSAHFLSRLDSEADGALKSADETAFDSSHAAFHTFGMAPAFPKQPIHAPYNAAVNLGYSPHEQWPMHPFDKRMDEFDNIQNAHFQSYPSVSPSVNRPQPMGQISLDDYLRANDQPLAIYTDVQTISPGQLLLPSSPSDNSGHDEHASYRNGAGQMYHQHPSLVSTSGGNSHHSSQRSSPGNDDVSPVSQASERYQSYAMAGQVENVQAGYVDVAYQTNPYVVQTTIKPESSGSTPSLTKTSSSSEHESDEPVRHAKKRKVVKGQESASTKAGGKMPPKKTAHNMIEKRYRNNLNDKIASLRDSVPSLRVIATNPNVNGNDLDDEDLDGLTPAHKLNKATVLVKATEYIRHLEKQSRRLRDENQELKSRLMLLENVGPPRRNQPIAQQYPQRRQPGGGAVSRLMVGGLAGLMVVNGLNSHDHGGHQHHGLFAFHMPSFLGTSANRILVEDFLGMLLKIALLFSALCYMLSPGIFDTDPQFAAKKAILASAPSLASPLEVRRKAWLTAIQTVWVPRHTFTLELAALGLKMLKLSVRKLIGWDGYAKVFGTTEEQEAIRVKAWLIALDAQLGGGDEAINFSRLFLTFLASLTLPPTPSRLMLNALHIRVFLFGREAHFMHGIAQRIADYYWKEARYAHELVSHTADALPSHLAQLVTLESSTVFTDRTVRRLHNLAHNRRVMPHEDGYDRAMDLIYEDFAISSPLDALAAWYSSLRLQDALIDALGDVEGAASGEISELILDNIQAATETAPPNSGPQIRAIVARALLSAPHRTRDIATIRESFELDLAASQVHHSSDEHSMRGHNTNRSILAPSNAGVTMTMDIRTGLRCAMILALLNSKEADSSLNAAMLFRGLEWRKINSSPGPQEPATGHEFGLLAFLASYRAMMSLAASVKVQSPSELSLSTDDATDDQAVALVAAEGMERVSAICRLWIGRSSMARIGMSGLVREAVVSNCLKISRKVSGMFVEEAELESDLGYHSSAETDSARRLTLKNNVEKVTT